MTLDGWDYTFLVAGLFSLCGCTLLQISYWKFPEIRGPFSRLILLASFSFSAKSLFAIIRGILRNQGCEEQAFYNHFTSLSALCWQTSIAWYVYQNAVRQNKKVNKPQYQNWMWFFNVAVPLLVCTTILVAQLASGVHLYGLKRYDYSWCSFDRYHQVLDFVALYMWAIISTLLYLILYIVMWRSARRAKAFLDKHLAQLEAGTTDFTDVDTAETEPRNGDGGHLEQGGENLSSDTADGRSLAGNILSLAVPSGDMVSLSSRATKTSRQSRFSRMSVRTRPEQYYRSLAKELQPLDLNEDPTSPDEDHGPQEMTLWNKCVDPEATEYGLSRSNSSMRSLATAFPLKREPSAHKCLSRKRSLLRDSFDPAMWQGIISSRPRSPSGSSGKLPRVPKGGEESSSLCEPLLRGPDSSQPPHSSMLVVPGLAPQEGTPSQVHTWWEAETGISGGGGDADVTRGGDVSPSVDPSGGPSQPSHMDNVSMAMHLMQQHIMQAADTVDTKPKKRFHRIETSSLVTDNVSEVMREEKNFVAVPPSIYVASTRAKRQIMAYMMTFAITWVIPIFYILYEVATPDIPLWVVLLAVLAKGLQGATISVVFFFLESVTLPKRVRDLLRDPSGLFYFEAFLEDYFAEENLMFVYAVDAMKDGGVESPHWRQLCQDIFQKFIDPNRAIREVNISDHVRTPIMDRMRRDNGLDIHMFDGARREVVSSLQNDLYRRFKTSRHCARLMTELRNEGRGLLGERKSRAMLIFRIFDLCRCGGVCFLWACCRRKKRRAHHQQSFRMGSTSSMMMTDSTGTRGPFHLGGVSSSFAPEDATVLEGEEDDDEEEDGINASFLVRPNPR